ncbi:MAG: hypothetical protein A2Z08_04755 [Deltaproteobacteria bacterium RBG_16_54_11]|nr:MAG: hypothetical protein A2Z08_04755 [Deltaproteobacteria bacterium RBG_16_54_11]
MRGSCLDLRKFITGLCSGAFLLPRRDKYDRGEFRGHGTLIPIFGMPSKRFWVGRKKRLTGAEIICKI